MEREREMCVRCGDPTEYYIDTHIDLRRNYIETSGQLSENCAEELNRITKEARREGISSAYGIE